MWTYITLAISTCAAVAGLVIEPYVERKGVKLLNKWLFVLVALVIAANGVAALQHHKAQERASLFANSRLEILWVDDNPTSKGLLSRITEVGGNISYASTNLEAMNRLREHDFSHVITDIGRVNLDGPTAGLKLLEEIQASGVDVPVMVFSRVAEQYAEQAEDFGADFVTHSPAEALVYLLDLLPMQNGKQEP